MFNMGSGVLEWLTGLPSFVLLAILVGWHFYRDARDRNIRRIIEQERRDQMRQELPEGLGRPRPIQSTHELSPKPEPGSPIGTIDGPPASALQQHLERERLRHFVSRDIEGLDEKRIAAFSQDGLIRQPGDIFRLDPAVIAKREGWGELSARNLMTAIDERRRIPLDRFINALGIPQVGQATARLLARHYRSLPNWWREMEAAQDPESEALARLVEIGGIGESMAANIIGFFAEPRNQAVLDDLAREVTVLDEPARISDIMALRRESTRSIGRR
jgi:hypothetical protein